MINSSAGREERKQQTWRTQLSRRDELEQEGGSEWDSVSGNLENKNGLTAAVCWTKYVIMRDDVLVGLRCIDEHILLFTNFPSAPKFHEADVL